MEKYTYITVVHILEIPAHGLNHEISLIETVTKYSVIKFLSSKIFAEKRLNLNAM
jgi:hypothetical protein